MLKKFCLILLLAMILMLSHFQGLAQKFDISGEWQGVLTQEDKTWVFRMTFLFQQTGENLTGTAKFVALDGSGAFAVFDVSGNLLRSKFSLNDLTMIDENNVRGTWYWCKKIYEGEVRKKGDSLIVQGDFHNEGKRGFHRMKLLENSGLYCAPGKFRLARLRKMLKEPTQENPVQKKSIPETPLKQDTSQQDPAKQGSVTQKPPPAKLPVRQEDVNPKSNSRVFLDRAPKLQQIITTTSDSLKLSFYDNAEIDDDTISVYVNRQLLFKNKRITDKPYVVMISVRPGVDTEILMHAENEGSIPPNTALLVVEDAALKKEILLRSTKTESATIIARRKVVK